MKTRVTSFCNVYLFRNTKGFNINFLDVCPGLGNEFLEPISYYKCLGVLSENNLGFIAKLLIKNGYVGY